MGGDHCPGFSQRQAPRGRAGRRDIFPGATQSDVTAEIVLLLVLVLVLFLVLFPLSLSLSSLFFLFLFLPAHS
jgi:hypothetical protein